MVATLGLVLVVFGSLRAARVETVAFAVGGYIAAAYWFTSSTSFANPAVTVARMLSDSFAGIAPGSVPMFVLMQLVGGGLGLALVRLLFPHPERSQACPAAPGARLAHRPVRLRPQRGPLPDGRRLPRAARGGRVRVLSAGSQPADAINPVAVAAMAEEGIDITTATPKVLTPEAVQVSDVVVTMGCGTPARSTPAATRTGSSTTRPVRGSSRPADPRRDPRAGRGAGRGLLPA